jgi:GPH family glycoside/pentoside/hexuronide:cation symporter
MKLVVSVICVSLGLFMVNQLGLYVNVYYVFGGEEKAASTMLGFVGMIYHLAGGILAAPIISIVSARIGKKKTMLGGLTLALIGTLTKFVTYSPEWPWMQVVSLVLMSPGLSCLWVLTPSVVADICDEDEFNTGVRREGMYSAVYTNMMKLGVSIGLLFVGFILNASGFDAELGANQSDRALMFMRVCFTAIPAVGLILGMSIISRIPMSAQRAEEVRTALDARHEEAAAE